LVEKVNGPVVEKRTAEITGDWKVENPGNVLSFKLFLRGSVLFSGEGHVLSEKKIWIKHYLWDNLTCPVGRNKRDLRASHRQRPRDSTHRSLLQIKSTMISGDRPSLPDFVQLYFQKTRSYHLG
jgi:hypothetical protein